MEPASKEYVDLKLASAMTHMDGKFDLLNQRMGTLEERTPSLWKVAAVVWSGFLGVIAVLALMNSVFNGGVSLSSMRIEEERRDAAQDARLNAFIDRVDALLASQAKQAAPAPGTPSE